MFAIELALFSMKTIIVSTSIWSNQPLKLITSTSLNLVEHVTKHVAPMSKPPILFVIPIKSVPVRPIKIIIPLNTFQQHLQEAFF
jgi:hypothetical protein